MKNKENITKQVTEPETVVNEPEDKAPHKEPLVLYEDKPYKPKPYPLKTHRGMW